MLHNKKLILNKKYLNDKGFTLVELLTVLVIIGVVLVIAIPSVSKLTHNSDNKKLDSLINMALEASDVYVDNYKKSFTENYDKYNFKYQTLLDNNLLKEEDIHCSGTIQATRKKGNNYTYNAYLMCKDKNGKEIYNNESELPDGGISIYGKFIMEYNVKLNDASGAKYNFDFTKENLYNEFVAYDLERPGTSAGISKFEYSFNGNDWTETIADSNSGVGSFTLTNTYNGKIYFRAYDLSGNSSETVEYTVKVDKEKPTGTITVARNGGSYDSLSVKATLSSTDNTDGSGVKQMCVQESSDVNTCSFETYTASKTLTLSGTLDGTTRTVYAWYKDKAGNVSTAYSVTYTPYKECDEVNYPANWSACTKACGTGTQTKAATDKYTGVACTSKNQTQNCNVMDCCSKKSVSGYGSWKACSKTCGGGVQYRDVSYKSDYNGQSCGTVTNGSSQACNTQSCTLYRYRDISDPTIASVKNETKKLLGYLCICPFGGETICSNYSTGVDGMTLCGSSSARCNPSKITITGGFTLNNTASCDAYKISVCPDGYVYGTVNGNTKCVKYSCPAGHTLIQGEYYTFKCYSPWSNWSSTKVTASDTREVEVKEG